VACEVQLCAPPLGPYTSLKSTSRQGPNPVIPCTEGGSSASSMAAMLLLSIFGAAATWSGVKSYSERLTCGTSERLHHRVKCEYQSARLFGHPCRQGPPPRTESWRPAHEWSRKDIEHRHSVDIESSCRGPAYREDTVGRQQ